MNVDERPGEASILKTIRDLSGLVALPAAWAGRDSQAILQTLVEAVECIVPLRFIFIQAALLPDQPPFQRLRMGHAFVDDEATRTWAECASGWATSPEPEGRAFTTATPLGSMQIIRLSLGHGTFGGKIWFGSPEPSFPTSLQLALLRTAASLAATSLQTARANYESEQAARAKDEFLAMLGHELRNPLAPIITALELIKLKHPGELHREHQIIERQTAHLSRLVDDLLDVTRIIRGKIELRRVPMDLRTAVTQALENIDPLLKNCKHTLRLNSPLDPVCVLGDSVRLVQVFTNLLTNSAKYTNSGGLIEVDVTRLHESVCVRVRDNGYGISAQLLPRLFTIFEQGRVGLDRAKGGLGIGLALVKNFVEQHDGSVTASSDGEGKGAEFVVTLPLLNAGANDPVAEQPASGVDKSVPMRTLLVDDNIDILDSMAEYLKLRGHVVRASRSPHAALEIAKQFRPHVAILDIGLPVMDGYALAGEMRKLFGPDELRLIALTGYGQGRDQESSLRAGFDVHLVKPVLLHELEAAILNGSMRPTG